VRGGELGLVARSVWFTLGKKMGRWSSVPELKIWEILAGDGRRPEMEDDGERPKLDERRRTAGGWPKMAHDSGGLVRGGRRWRVVRDGRRWEEMGRWREGGKIWGKLGGKVGTEMRKMGCAVVLVSKFGIFNF